MASAESSSSFRADTAFKWSFLHFSNSSALAYCSKRKIIQSNLELFFKTNCVFSLIFDLILPVVLHTVFLAMILFFLLLVSL